jgi:GntR family transcriptional repressor for pyruvate dehydrogenase complex
MVAGFERMTGYRYQRVRSSPLYEEVAAQQERSILDGALESGDRLPSESDLAQQYGVSRTVTREAIQNPRSRRLVDVVHGSGSYVGEPKTDAVVETLSTLFQFRGASPYSPHEVREILETEIAGLAAERATESDIAELQNALSLMEEARSSGREYVEVDLLFHAMLARATRNHVFLLLLEPLVDLLRQGRLLAIQAPGGIRKSCRGHYEIYQCVLTRDPKGARAAMREHLSEVRERLTVVEAQVGA